MLTTTPTAQHHNSFSFLIRSTGSFTPKKMESDVPEEELLYSFANQICFSLFWRAINSVFIYIFLKRFRFLPIWLQLKATFTLSESTSKQECIPVGCVPAAHWPYDGEGESPCWGASLPGGSPCQEVGSPCWGYPYWGVLPGGGGLPAGGVGVSLLGGGFSLLETSPVDRIIDMSKNITLATTSLRPVMIQIYCWWLFGPSRSEFHFNKNAFQ